MGIVFESGGLEIIWKIFRKKSTILKLGLMLKGISALMNLDTDGEDKQLVKSMKKAADSVHTAMVTRAARDSDFDGHQILEGEYLGILDGVLLGNYSDEEMLLEKIGLAFDKFSPEVITLYYGQGVNGETAAEAAAVIRRNNPKAELTVVDGGQPVYHYIISAE